MARWGSGRLVVTALLIGLAVPSFGGEPPRRPVRLFLGGDVMSGRGIDQVLPHPSDPLLHEPAVSDARLYLRLAEQASGPIPRPADFSYIWGDALAELRRFDPDLRLVNLETSITDSDEHWRGKGINYRMHPANIDCLLAAGISACSLANNHVLDWGYPGLAQTLETLEAAGIRCAGAGRTQAQARAAAVLEVEGGGRVLLFSFGSLSSGIPPAWAAAADRAGVWLLEDLSEREIREIAAGVREQRRAGDLVVASIHWGGNWGYQVEQQQRRFAHRLIEEAGVDLVHGHSSHHPRPIEIHQGKLILYGCGDFINDYEGIGGYERYRGDLVLMYLVQLDPASGRLAELTLVPLKIRRFRLERASRADARWLAETLNRYNRSFATRLELQEDATLSLRRTARR